MFFDADEVFETEVDAAEYVEHDLQVVSIQ